MRGTSKKLLSAQKAKKEGKRERKVAHIYKY
jgi:hypothetical protein